MIYVCTVVSSGVYVFVQAVKISRTVSLLDKKKNKKKKKNVAKYLYIRFCYATRPNE